MSQRIKFYADEHIARAVIRGLRHRGVDVLTVPEAGLLGASDEEHLARATQEVRVLFTQDADFLRIHTSGLNHAGIVYVNPQSSTGEVIYGLMLIYQVLEPEEMANNVEYL